MPVRPWAVAALLSITLAACYAPAATPSPSPEPSSSPTAAPSPTGLSVDEATPLLLAHAGPASTQINWIRHGELGDFVEIGTVNMDFRREVWAASVTGVIAISCPLASPPRPCPDVIGRTVIVIDYYTGEFLLSASGG